MAIGIVAMAALAVVFGVYPLLDRTDSPVVQAVDEVLDQSSGSTGLAGGEVPDGQTTLDDDIPAITKLDPALAAAVQEAADAAAADGISFWITSGWRSAAYQQALLDQAVQKHGSLEAARRTVSTPELSRHVTGKAIDIGPTEGAYWTIQNGAKYGLCQVYANEVWHFERRTEPGGTCPELLADSSEG